MPKARVKNRNADLDLDPMAAPARPVGGAKEFSDSSDEDYS